MISIICVYNNKEILNDFLLKSLKNQSVEYELILMDNSTGKFKSAAAALNEGGNKVKGKYIMFVHQDIDLKSNKWLEDTEKTLDSLENMGITGVAGRIKYKPGIVTNIADGIPPKIISKDKLKSPIEVQTLDECLFIIPHEVFEVLKFDEKTVYDWHLYAADYALSVKKLGLKTYVIPLFVYHRSSGFSYSEMYDKTLKKLLRKHMDEKAIYTTIEDWVTFYPIELQKKIPSLKNKTIDILRNLKA